MLDPSEPPVDDCSSRQSIASHTVVDCVINNSVVKPKGKLMTYHSPKRSAKHKILKKQRSRQSWRGCSQERHLSVLLGTSKWAYQERSGQAPALALVCRQHYCCKLVVVTGVITILVSE